MQILKDLTKKETRLARRLSSPSLEHFVFMCLISRVTGHWDLSDRHMYGNRVNQDFERIEAYNRVKGPPVSVT
jgi:hypothetical protein